MLNAIAKISICIPAVNSTVVDYELKNDGSLGTQ